MRREQAMLHTRSNTPSNKLHQDTMRGRHNTQPGADYHQQAWQQQQQQHPPQAHGGADAYGQPQGTDSYAQQQQQQQAAYQYQGAPSANSFQV